MNIEKRIKALKYTLNLLCIEFNTTIGVAKNVFLNMVKELDILDCLKSWWTNDRRLVLSLNSERTLVFKSLSDYNRYYDYSLYKFQTLDKTSQDLNISILCLTRKLRDPTGFFSVGLTGKFSNYIEVWKRPSGNVYFEMFAILSGTALREVFYIEFWTTLFDMMDKFIKT